MRSIKKVLANKSSAMTPQNQGKAEAEEKLRTTVDNQKPQNMLAWVTKCRHSPVFERHGEGQRLRIIFATERTIKYKLRKQDGEADQWVGCMSVEVVLVTTKGGSSQKKEMQTQELTKRVFFAAGHARFRAELCLEQVQDKYFMRFPSIKKRARV